MRSVFLLASLGLCACATPRTGEAVDVAAAARTAEAADGADVTTVETVAGSFQVRSANKEELEKLLAGEPTSIQFFAGGP